MYFRYGLHLKDAHTVLLQTDNTRSLFWSINDMRKVSKLGGTWEIPGWPTTEWTPSPPATAPLSGRSANQSSASTRIPTPSSACKTYNIKSLLKIKVHFYSDYFKMNLHTLRFPVVLWCISLTSESWCRAGECIRFRKQELGPLTLKRWIWMTQI